MSKIKFMLKEKEIQNDFKEFCNKHDLGQCILISLSEPYLLAAEGYEVDFIKNKLYSTIAQIYWYIIQPESSDQTIEDWVKNSVYKDMEMSIEAMKMDIKKLSENVAEFNYFYSIKEKENE